MKALSIRQPWASLIAEGSKTIEVRSWPTKYRGPLLICAGKKAHVSLPTGVAVAIVDVVDCRPFVVGQDEAAACCESDPGDFAWVLDNVRPIEHVSVSGKLGIFTVELPDLEAEMERPGRTEPAVSRLEGERSIL